MFSIPGLVALLFIVFVRPQEVIVELQRIPIIEMSFGLALFGLVIDARLGHIRLRPGPQVPWAAAAFLWMMATVAITASSRLVPAGMELVILLGIFVVIAQGVQSFRALSLIAGVLLALALALAAVGIHQGVSPFGCAKLDLSHRNDLSIGIPDGRPCAQPLDCRGPGAEPGALYICERIGMLGTTSIGEGRIRYRGLLQDPNELALATSVALAFAFLFAARRRTRTRRVLVVVATVMVAICVVMTKSRGGQLAFIAVVGISLARRLGRKRLVRLAIAATPVVVTILILGGRSGAEADESAELRLVAWREGLRMLMEHPLLGVGQDHFTLYHGYTAHNSYVLTAAELGLPGFVLWSALLYLAIKIPLTGARRYAGVVGAEVARDWGVALLAATTAMLIGIFFLSMSYHALLWIYLALASAYYGACSSHDPRWRIHFGLRDLGLVIALDVALLAGTWIFVRLKGM